MGGDGREAGEPGSAGAQGHAAATGREDREEDEGGERTTAWRGAVAAGPLAVEGSRTTAAAVRSQGKGSGEFFLENVSEELRSPIQRQYRARDL